MVEYKKGKLSMKGNGPLLSQLCDLESSLYLKISNYNFVQIGDHPTQKHFANKIT